MLTTAALEVTSLRLAGFYRANQGSLNESMVRISSGKRINQPADNGADFFRVQQLRSDIIGFGRVQRDLAAGSALLDVASAVGSSVFEDINRMQEFIKLYYDPSRTDDQRAADAVEFGTIKNRVINTIANAYYGQDKLIADNGSTPLRKITLDPRDASQTFDISFDAGDVADVSGLTIGVSDRNTEMAALQTELNKAASYLAKTTVYSDLLAVHHNLAGQQAVFYQQSADNTEGIDEGAAVMQMTKQNICQQMTVSMLAQANMFRSSVLALVSGK